MLFFVDDGEGMDPSKYCKTLIFRVTLFSRERNT